MVQTENWRKLPHVMRNMFKGIQQEAILRILQANLHRYIRQERHSRWTWLDPMWDVQEMDSRTLRRRSRSQKRHGDLTARSALRVPLLWLRKKQSVREKDLEEEKRYCFELVVWKGYINYIATEPIPEAKKKPQTADEVADSERTYWTTSSPTSTITAQPQVGLFLHYSQLN